MPTKKNLIRLTGLATAAAVVGLFVWHGRSPSGESLAETTGVASPLRCKLMPLTLFGGAQLACDVLVDSLTVTDVKINRGKCPTSYQFYTEHPNDRSGLKPGGIPAEHVSYLKAYKYSETIYVPIYSGVECNLIEYSIDTDKGTFSAPFVTQ